MIVPFFPPSYLFDHNLKCWYFLQGDKIRKRDNWSKWVPASKRSASEEKIGDSDKGSSKSITSRDHFRNPSKGTSKPTACDCSSEVEHFSSN